MKPTRQYSRQFTVGAQRRHQINLTVPAALARQIRAKAKAQGVSVRALVLTYLQDWVADDPAATNAQALTSLAALKAALQKVQL